MTGSNPAKHLLLGHAPPSPKKKRSKKRQQPVNLSIQQSRREALQRRFDAIRSREPTNSSSDIPNPESSAPPPSSDTTDINPESMSIDIDPVENLPDSCELFDDSLPPPSACAPAPLLKKDEEAARTSRWKETLKLLVGPLIEYTDRTMGVSPEEVVRATGSPCRTGTCIVEVTTLRVINFDHHRSMTFSHCRCQTLPQILVTRGYFPSSPSQPRMAISIELLEFYRILCQQSSDAVTALANGLTMLYRRRGFRLVGATGEPLQDPIRRALGTSLQWYDTLVIEVERYVTKKVDNIKHTLPPLSSPVPSSPSPLTVSPAFALLGRTLNSSPAPPSTSPATPSSDSSLPTPTPGPTPSPNSSLPTPTPGPNPASPAAPPASTGAVPPIPPLEGSCDPYLQRLCPACFGGNRFGQSFQWGGDIHVALDGNLHHRHLKSGGDGVPFHSSTRYLSKEFVDGIGERIAAARQAPPKARSMPLSDDVVDSDRDAYKAARSDGQKRSNEIFDENGVMALVCRHDIPLFVASIDTPSERQTHAVALLQALFDMLAPGATVAGLYDIACVLDRSLNLYEFLDEDIVSRLQLATAAMHAYGHQWSCQLYYNPRLREGLGITDGEGTERLWSRLRKLIGLERRASCAKRIWLFDRQCDTIAQDLFEGLGKYIKRKLYKNVQKKESEAIQVLRKFGTAPSVLRQYWREQKDAQSSGATLTPAHLKKDLSKVFQLQDQIDDLEHEIAEVKSTVKKLPFPPSDALFILQNLEKLHGKLKSEAEGLYASLNIDNQYPQLKGIPLEYLHTLLLARDLKITIRKKAIGSFFEWDRLDQAMGGADEALGTRAHQLTRKNISRRAAAFENLIRKFNQHVTYLEQKHKPAYGIPVPRKLPTQLAALRDMETSHLWEDVSVTQSEQPPEYLINENSRREIRALLNLDRCAEERARLDAESKNMCTWYFRELQALMFMVRDEKYRKYHTALQARLHDHQLLASNWANPFVSITTFERMVTSVERWLGSPPSPSTPISRTTSNIPALAPRSPQHPGSFSSPSMPFSPPSVSTPCLPRPLVSFPSPSMPTLSSISSSRLRTPAPVLPRSPPSHSTPQTLLSPTVFEEDGDDDDEDDEFEITGIRLALEDVMADCEPNNDEEDSMSFRWDLPTSLLVDANLWPGIRGYRFPPFDRTASASRSFYSPAKVQYVFHVAQYQRLDAAERWLDDECINGCAALLQNNFWDPNVNCAIFSSFVLPEVLKNSMRTETAWRNSYRTEYWTKSIWIIPIHDAEEHHWGLAVVRVAKEEIHIFDSFGSQEFVARWAPRIQVVVSRLVDMAKDHGYPLISSSLSTLACWTARPLQMERLQHNSYDCGVWILWIIAAVVRGFDYACIEEQYIPKFRKYLANLVRTIPVT
ncbi:hypothetical protein PQX77_011236 [Marasmius sp. AFHP31]|nr:hypothetical protein PQX77_011236 [Marasmius sp. AFHP31]